MWPSGGAADEDGWQERLWSQESINVRVLSFSESELKLRDLLEKRKKYLCTISRLAIERCEFIIQDEFNWRSRRSRGKEEESSEAI